VSIKDCTLRVSNKITALFLSRARIKAIFIHHVANLGERGSPLETMGVTPVLTGVNMLMPEYCPRGVIAPAIFLGGGGGGVAGVCGSLWTCSLVRSGWVIGELPRGVCGLCVVCAWGVDSSVT